MTKSTGSRGSSGCVTTGMPASAARSASVSPPYQDRSKPCGMTTYATRQPRSSRIDSATTDAGFAPSRVTLGRSITLHGREREHPVVCRSLGEIGESGTDRDVAEPRLPQAELDLDWREQHELVRHDELPRGLALFLHDDPVVEVESLAQEVRSRNDLPRDPLPVGLVVAHDGLRRNRDDRDRVPGLDEHAAPECDARPDLAKEAVHRLERIEAVDHVEERVGEVEAVCAERLDLAGHDGDPRRLRLSAPSHLYRRIDRGDLVIALREQRGVGAGAAPDVEELRRSGGGVLVDQARERINLGRVVLVRRD